MACLASAAHIETQTYTKVSEQREVDDWLGADKQIVNQCKRCLKEYYHVSKLKETLIKQASEELRLRIPRIALRHLPCLTKWLILHDPVTRSILENAGMVLGGVDSVNRKPDPEPASDAWQDLLDYSSWNEMFDPF
jgi:hypothetical protein